MPNMLTQDDLKAIGQLIDDRVPPIVEKVLDSKLNDPQGVLNIKLDAMQETIDEVVVKVDNLGKKVDLLDKRVNSVENQMLTIERLERYEIGMTERYDRRYVRQTPQEKTSA